MTKWFRKKGSKAKSKASKKGVIRCALQTTSHSVKAINHREVFKGHWQLAGALHASCEQKLGFCVHVKKEKHDLNTSGQSLLIGKYHFSVSFTGLDAHDLTFLECQHLFSNSY